MKKSNWLITFMISCLIVIFAVAAFGPVKAGLIYDIVGGNALIRGHLDVKEQIDAPRIITSAVDVNDYQQLDTVAGVSVYFVDLSLGTRFNVDPVAINASAVAATPYMVGWVFTGVTVVSETVTATNDRVEWEVMCVNVSTSGATPVVVSAPQNSGVTTHFATGQTLRGLGASGEWLTGVSLWRIDDQGDRSKFRNSFGTGVSIFEIESRIGS